MGHFVIHCQRKDNRQPNSSRETACKEQEGDSRKGTLLLYCFIEGLCWFSPMPITYKTYQRPLSHFFSLSHVWIGISGPDYSGMPGLVCSGTGGPLCSGIGGRIAPEYAI